MDHATMEELEAGLESIRAAPDDDGTLVLIVRRPDVGEREELAAAVLDVREGLVGDNWLARGNRHTEDGSAEPGCQLTLMNDRVARLVAGDPARRALAGDQLFVDLDLGAANLPAGTRLAVGSAVIEVSPIPHTGCAKFVERFGADAARFVNVGPGRELHLRGINAIVVEGGRVRVGDRISKRR
jgi:hypothetical protein